MEPEDRLEALLRFGREHFALHGYDALSVDQIASRAGVSKGTIYNYFGGRRGFYLATIERAVDDLLAAIEPPPGASLGAVLPGMTGAFVAFAAEHEGIYLAVVRGGLGADEEVGSLLERVRVAAMRHIADALALRELSPRLDLAIAGWVAFVEATTARWLADRPVPASELVELFTANLASLLEQNG